MLGVKVEINNDLKITTVILDIGIKIFFLKIRNHLNDCKKIPIKIKNIQKIYVFKSKKLKSFKSVLYWSYK